MKYYITVLSALVSVVLEATPLYMEVEDPSDAMPVPSSRVGTDESIQDALGARKQKIFLQYVSYCMMAFAHMMHISGSFEDYTRTDYQTSTALEVGNVLPLIGGLMLSVANNWTLSSDLALHKSSPSFAMQYDPKKLRKVHNTIARLELVAVIAGLCFLGDHPAYGLISLVPLIYWYPIFWSYNQLLYDDSVLAPEAKKQTSHKMPQTKDLRIRGKGMPRKCGPRFSRRDLKRQLIGS